MNIAFITGWIFLLAAWFPKPFIKDTTNRITINLILTSIAVGIFIGSFIESFINLITK